ncbi:unnamed protein product [Adineta ricciae]|uniref:t-SNARE coiled-coil homology domain-containing protein n=1 Tax=Adineta ricciae TaxID=249248 RepID=A0A815QZ04_ADIRI|nr:unnamed protein product [Adineta ricciae]
MDPLESENDRRTKELAAKISQLKNIAIDIDDDTTEHNRFLETMRSDFDTARGFLAGSSHRLTDVLINGKSDRRTMYYVIGGIVFSFIFLYYIVSSFRRK